VLHADQELAHVRGNAGHGEDQADGAVALVHAAIGLDARIVLPHAAAVAEPGRAVVAGARVDLREAVSHGLSSAELVPQGDEQAPPHRVEPARQLVVLVEQVLFARTK
jgi:hypothetical protein